MTERAPASSPSSLAYEDSLPFRWHVVESVPGQVQMARQHEHDEDMLRILSGLEDHPPELPDDHPIVAAELRRLEFKMNLIMDLLAQVVKGQVELPASRWLRLTAAGAEWDDSNPPPANALLQLDLYLNPRFPRPLTLLARVQKVEPQSSGAQRVRVQFDSLSATVTDWLERFIFVHHRRQVAHARRSHP